MAIDAFGNALGNYVAESMGPKASAPEPVQAQAQNDDPLDIEVSLKRGMRTAIAQYDNEQRALQANTPGVMASGGAGWATYDPVDELPADQQFAAVLASQRQAAVEAKGGVATDSNGRTYEKPIVGHVPAHYFDPIVSDYFWSADSGLPYVPAAGEVAQSGSKGFFASRWEGVKEWLSHNQPSATDINAPGNSLIHTLSELPKLAGIVVTGDSYDAVSNNLKALADSAMAMPIGRSVRAAMVAEAQAARLFDSVAGSTAARSASKFDSFALSEGRLQESLDIWPPNMGRIGPVGTIDLQPGFIMDRFGLPNGRFVSPQGVPFTNRALPSGYESSKPYFLYEVVKTIPGVTQSRALPWFGKDGMGAQLELPKGINYLDPRNGYVKVRHYEQ